ncbi:MAG: NAD-dependent epimerase/dehydratase family protein [Deltaproteobacteria bacterium]|nr:NAD-dependent epimerase/dehydratase family protein [Deltaproteobacteria bacterium]
MINCAAYGSYPSDQRQDLIYRVNFDSVRAMLEVLKDSPGLRGFIQAGSSSEYGFNCAAPRENMACEPDSHFSVSKLGATQLVQFYGRRFNVPAWSLRLSSVYGPLEEFSRLIPQICWKALKGTLPDLASPEISRDFVYIDDVLEAFEAVMMKADSLACGEVYNIGSGICTTLGHLAETAREIFGITDLPRCGQFADRGWDHPSWYANPEKGVAFLGWNVRVPLVDGLRKTYAWMEQNPETVLASEKYSIIQRGKGNVGFGRDAGARRSGNPEAPPQASP